MSERNDGGPAFPVPQGANVQSKWGMTLRDYFAAKAMKLWLNTGHTDPEAAKRAYAMADAMLEAREISND